MKRLIFISVLTFWVVVGHSDAVSIEADLTLTSKQKVALDNFKEIVHGRLPHEYMYEDIALIRWLRARDFNLKEAEKMLLQHLEWRSDNKIDQIMNERWREEMKKQYTYYTDTVDKEGRPILFIEGGQWDIRLGLISGQENKLRLYIHSLFEEMAIKLRKMRIEGKNVTQFYLISDSDGFSLHQGCPRCVTIMLEFVTDLQLQYPGSVHKIVTMNAPGFLQPIANALKNFMTKETREFFFVFGRTGPNSEANAHFTKDIDSDQLFKDLGGTRERP